MKYHITLLIELKDGILDPQGRAVEGVLKGLQYQVGDVRVGRVLEMELEAASEALARATAHSIGQTLANPVMEVFVVEAVKELA